MTVIAILKTGSTLPAVRQQHGDFEHWFREKLGNQVATQVIDVAAGDSPGKPEDWDGIVVTGSPAMVTDREPWSEATAHWLRHAVERETPLLGVCYGHQLLADALGGEVSDRPQGRESGTFEVSLRAETSDDPLFRQLPKRFRAHLTHQQSVIRLPAAARLLAASSAEAHQAFRVGPCAWGVQFHPEFTADVMRAYLDVQAPALATAGQRVNELKKGVRDTPYANHLLLAFSSFVHWRHG